jgi:dolichyl-phosphate-mannose-protein mannosyltransferase
MTLRNKPSQPVGPEISRTHATGTPSGPVAPKESGADARLRDRDHNPSTWPRKDETAALGGRRRVGGSGRLRKREWYILGVVCLIATVVRLWRIHHPTSVV